MELALLDRIPDRDAQVVVPAPVGGGDGVAHGTGLRVEVDERGGEEASAGEDAVARVRDPGVEQGRDAAHAAGFDPRGLEHVLAEPLRRRLDGRELQALLRAEQRRDAALAHVRGRREAADREPVEPLDRREVGRALQHDAPGGVAPESSAVDLFHVL